MQFRLKPVFRTLDFGYVMEVEESKVWRLRLRDEEMEVEESKE